jgi:hypothetical protein
MSLEDNHFKRLQIDDIWVDINETREERDARLEYIRSLVVEPTLTLREITRKVMEKFPRWANRYLIEQADHKKAFGAALLYMSKHVDKIEGKYIKAQFRYHEIEPDVYITTNEIAKWFSKPENVKDLSWTQREAIILALGIK